jgi:tRNA (guanine-N7-)-methyltransferase
VTKRKLQRFAEVATFANFFQPPLEEVIQGFRMRGKWAQDYFHNYNPVFLELGCGKGEYAVGLARKYPSDNYIGVDIKGARMWRGAKTALEENLGNVAFLRTQIGLIDKLFGEGEVNGIWITFPDPQPQHSREHQRLTSSRFLKLYRRILVPGSVIHLKTDNNGLFEYTLGVIGQQKHQLLYSTRDLYNEPVKDDAGEIQTFYERIWLEQGMKVNYLRFILKLEDES